MITRNRCFGGKPPVSKECVYINNMTEPLLKKEITKSGFCILIPFRPHVYGQTAKLVILNKYSFFSDILQGC